MNFYQHLLAFLYGPYKPWITTVILFLVSICCFVMFGFMTGMGWLVAAVLSIPEGE